MTATAGTRQWPAEGLTRVPYWIYSDADIFEAEQERIFQGATWNFLCLEAELPGPNTYRRSNLGAMPVVVTRDKDGELHAFENRCAHRGSLLVLKESGEAKDIICVYHNWSYDLCGTLTGVAFRRGIGGKGGMPPDAKPDAHPPRKLKLATWRASCSARCRTRRLRSSAISGRRSRPASAASCARRSSRSAATASGSPITGSSTWRT
jgi:nitrite reductase/ring-hydroxylating ferredoxin subunit